MINYFLTKHITNEVFHFKSEKLLVNNLKYGNVLIIFQYFFMDFKQKYSIQHRELIIISDYFSF